MTVMCQCRFMDCVKCTIVVQVVVSGREVVHMWGQEVYGNSELSVQFSCKLRNTLKIKFIN